MAQYGGDKEYRKEEGHVHNPLHDSTATGAGHDIGGTGSHIHSTTAGHTIGTQAQGHGYEEGKHGGAGGGGGILHRTGSGSSSEDDGEGGRRKKKGAVEKIKEKLPGGDHGGVEHKTSETATIGGGGHEKKGMMEKIKDKLPGGH